jgi:hypothetical protein
MLTENCKFNFKKYNTNYYRNFYLTFYDYNFEYLIQNIKILKQE